MAILDVRSFAKIVGTIAAAAQGKITNILLDYSTGSFLKAIAEAEAGVALWLQGNSLKVLSSTRLATSKGTDVDSFIIDWGASRLGAILSSGTVTFTRFTPTAQAVILAGAIVRTADGSQSFTVIAGSTNSAYSALLGGFILPVAVPSITIPVQSLIPGFAANVAANTITVLVTTIVGVDYCNNSVAMTGGSDAESDKQATTRFPLYIASVGRGTITAIQGAVAALQAGMQATVLENQNPDYSANPGFLTVTVDDGTGYPPSATLTAAATAVGAARAGGIQWGVFAPIVLQATIAATLTVAQGYDRNAVIAAVAAAISKYVNTLPLGATLPFSKIATVAYEASPGVANVSGVVLNGGTMDLVATMRNTIKVSSLSVN